jgi:hypothetical protein
MSELTEIYEIHKSCGFKDKDIKKAYERRCTPANVSELFRVIEALKAENDRLISRVYSLEDTYIHSEVKGCNP